MSSAVSVEKQISEILHDVAKKLNFTNYSLNLNLDAHKGDGFLGEFYKASITDNETDSEHHFALKKAPTEQIRREEDHIEEAYCNEIFFYSELVPALYRFELDHHVTKPFDSIAKYFTSNKEPGREIIALDDITKRGFVLRQKDLLLDDDHVKLICRTYGHFHAISFCMKEKNPEEFSRLTKTLYNVMDLFADNKTFKTDLKSSLEKALEGLHPTTDGNILEKFRKYVNKINELFKNSCNYQGQYYGIIYGDCWCNNMMFKYQGVQNYSKVEAVKLLDFQLITCGTPVHDLSYFFYSGGSKDLFDKLEYYLDVYHESFSKSCREVGCDPDKLFPREALREDWKKYARFGMILSFLVAKVKLISKEDSIKVIEAADNNQTEETRGSVSFDNLNFDETLFKKRTRDILVHAYEIGIL